MKRLSVCLAATLVACGTPMGETDAGRDAGSTVTLDAGARTDAGVDAGMLEPDAGNEPPPRTVFGDITIDGVSQPLWYGYANTTATLHQLRLVTNGAPRYQLTVLLPASATSGFHGLCGMTPNVFFGAQAISDAGVAYYTLDAGCDVTLSHVPQAAGEDFEGTLAATAELDPRSSWDAGAPVLVLSNGTFRVVRSF